MYSYFGLVWPTLVSSIHVDLLQSTSVHFRNFGRLLITLHFFFNQLCYLQNILPYNVKCILFLKKITKFKTLSNNKCR